MTRFPYRFDQGGPVVLGGLPVIHAPRLELLVPWRLMIVRTPDGHAAAYTGDPDFEWTFYRAECHDQARRIVRDGLRKRVPWLRASI